MVRRDRGADARGARARRGAARRSRTCRPRCSRSRPTCTSPGRLADLVASNLRLRLAEAQEILEIQDPLARLRRVDALLRRELEVSTMQAEIQSQAKEEMSRGQREHFLREQLRAIQAELGETDPRIEEIEEYRAKIEEAALPGRGARARRCASCAASSACTPTAPRRRWCAATSTGWSSCPGRTASPDRLDLANARAILDEDHAHLEGIKDRILEFLGVRKLRAGLARTDPLLRRSARRRQDLARPLDRARDGPRVRARLARRRARRGRDPRPPPHLRRRAARPHHPGPEAGGHQQPRLHARRDRQARRRLPRRSVGGAARGARPRAERAASATTT